MIEQDKWQAYYQILSITFLKEFIAFNVNTDTMIKNVRLVELKISIATVFLNIQNLRRFTRIQMFAMQRKLSTQIWWKVKETVFSYIQIF